MRLESLSLRPSGVKTPSESAYACVLFMIILSWCFSCSEGCLQEERRVLLQFKDAYNKIFEQGTMNYIDDWVGEDCCLWSRVTCDNYTTHVVAIRTSGFLSFRGFDPFFFIGRRGNGTEIIQMVCRLKFLEELDLSWSALEGMVPPCLGNMTSLKSLDLSNNRLQGSVLSTLGNLRSLLSLRLSNNQFLGNFLASLCSSHSLATMDLSNNFFQGTIPACFSNFSKLTELHMSNNQFEGPFAISLGSLQSLETLDLSSNLFKDNISNILFKWHSLKHVDLSNNRIQGTISPSVFRNQISLEYIDISSNEFRGMLSLSIFAKLSGLFSLSLSNNQFEVETYSSLWKPSFSLTTLRLSNCNLNTHGVNKFLSFLSTQNQLYELDISYNSFTGKIPTWFWLNVTKFLYLQGNMFENPFHQPLQNVTPVYLEKLDMSDNRMSGALPYNLDNWFPNLNFFNLSSNYLKGRIPELSVSIEILDLSNNNFSGKIPHSLTKNCTSLQYLDLSGNSLEGEILHTDSNLGQLQYFKLSNNHFTGSIPPAIANCSRMILLDIRNNNLSGDISKSLTILPQLRALLLGGNHLQGQIPIQLCHMNRLQFIDLSNNNLSGKLPSCLNNFSFMENRPVSSEDFFIGEISGFWIYERVPIQVSAVFTTKGKIYSYEGVPLRLMRGIDISSNQLTGEIPSEIGLLKDIRSLNLSHNLLTGVIPASFQNLEILESLDVSFNNLTGGISAKLAQLPFLSTFIVSYNNLSGKIPSGGQLSTFHENSFIGNPGLCGLPLMKDCPDNSPTSPTALDPIVDEGEKTEIIENQLFFYSWIAFSYALGFAGVITFLLLKHNWRYRFFKAVDMYWHLQCILQFLPAETTAREANKDFNLQTINQKRYQQTRREKMKEL
ncbi:receptor-like protein 9b isoform X2 [Aristolochia californica]|uniref:receptor-like protein 9b isoform X2 n=1 Tax=Aristolochia californica TaxID=171875 RepID=UPI0035E2B163